MDFVNMVTDVNIYTRFLLKSMMETRQEATANNHTVLKAQLNKDQEM